MIIYSLDPGKCSGYCIIDCQWFNDNGSMEFRIEGIIEAGTFQYEPKEVLNQLYKARKADLIIIEDFIVRKSLIGDKIVTIRVIGAFEVFFGDKVIFQQPSEKARVPDGVLKSNSLWNSSLHVRDAFRHFLIWAYKKRGRRTIKQNMSKRLQGGV